LTQSFKCDIQLKISGSVELRKKPAGSFNGACNKLREKSYKGCKSNKILCRFEFLPKYIYGIAQGLKGVKTDSNREDNVQMDWLELHSNGLESPDETVDKEIAIFEIGQKSHIHDDT
jgi:hypothetical protein